MWLNQQSTVVNNSVDKHRRLYEPRDNELPSHYNFDSHVSNIESTVTQSNDEPLNLCIKSQNHIGHDTNEIKNELADNMPTKRFKYCSDEIQEVERESKYPNTKYVLEYGKYVPGKQFNITVETDENYDKNHCKDDKINDIHLNTDFSAAIRTKYSNNETQNVATDDDYHQRSYLAVKYEIENHVIELNMSDGTVRHQNQNQNQNQRLSDEREIVQNEKPPIKLFRPFLPDYESSKTSPTCPVQWQLPPSNQQQRYDASYVPHYQTPQNIIGNYQPIYGGSQTVHFPGHTAIFPQCSQPEWTSTSHQYAVTVSSRVHYDEFNQDVVNHSEYSGEFEQLLQHTTNTHPTEGNNSELNGVGHIKHVESSLTVEKEAALESYYQLLKILSLEDQMKLAEQLDLSHVRVQTWFRNRSSQIEIVPKKKNAETLLELYFNLTKFVSRPKLIKLADELKMSEVRVALWFRNRRNKDTQKENNSKRSTTFKSHTPSYIHGRPRK